jgi:hypothetical protein
VLVEALRRLAAGRSRALALVELLLSVVDLLLCLLGQLLGLVHEAHVSHPSWERRTQRC